MLDSFAVICGPFLDLESVHSIKSFFNNVGCSNINYQSNFNINFDLRFTFLVNSTINGLELVSMCLFIAINVRLESPLLNYRLRKNFIRNNGYLPCFSLGLATDYLTFPVLNFGNSSKLFLFLVEGRLFSIKNLLMNDFLTLKFLNYSFVTFDKFSIFLGSSSLSRSDGSFFFNGVCVFLQKYFFSSDFWRGSLNIVSNFLGRLSCFELGALPGVSYSSCVLRHKTHKNSITFLCGVDEFFSSDLDNFVVFQGSFHNHFTKSVNLVFPVSLYTERVSFFLSLEGRFRKSQKIISCFKYINTDKEVMKSLYFFRTVLRLDNFSVMVNFNFLSKFFVNVIDYSCSFFSVISILPKLNVLNVDHVAPFLINLFLTWYGVSSMLNSVFCRTINNYYMTDQFTNNSKIMSICFLKIPSSSFSSNLLDKLNSL